MNVDLEDRLLRLNALCDFTRAEQVQGRGQAASDKRSAEPRTHKVPYYLH